MQKNGSTKFFYVQKHWKLAVHLILKTKRFGVNNKWWEVFDSPWGIAWYKMLGNCLVVLPLFHAYLAMKNRMNTSIGFVPEKEFKVLFSSNKKIRVNNSPINNF